MANSIEVVLMNHDMCEAPLEQGAEVQQGTTASLRLCSDVYRVAIGMRGIEIGMIDMG